MRRYLGRLRREKFDRQRDQRHPSAAKLPLQTLRTVYASKRRQGLVSDRAIYVGVGL